MPKTYNTIPTVSTGDVYTATAHNAIGTTINSMRVPPMCSVYFGTNTTYTQDTDISWTAQDFTNTDGMWTSGGNITIQTAGLYLVTFTGRATATVSAGARAVLNIADSPSVHGPEQATTDFRWSISLVRSFAASNTISARLQWSGSGTVTLQGSASLRPTLTATWLGQVS